MSRKRVYFLVMIQGLVIPYHTTRNQSFYEIDDCNRLMLGKKDFMSVILDMTEHKSNILRALSTLQRKVSP
jgi:hypothetical protein